MQFFIFIFWHSSTCLQAFLSKNYIIISNIIIIIIVIILLLLLLLLLLMEQLKEKHPEPQGVQLGSLLFGPIEDVPDTLYYEINGDMVRDAALRTKGLGGPSGVDAKGFRRILTCKSF